MKKILVVAHMLFASATVFGMDQSLVSGEQTSSIGRSDSVEQMSALKETAKRVFDDAQRLTKTCSWLSEDAKVLYRNLDFDEVWKQIALVKASEAPDRENAGGADSVKNADFFDKILSNVRSGKTYVNLLERSTMDKAKRFYKQVLGDSELGKFLYQKAVETIDSGKYTQVSILMAIRNSYWLQDEGITCSYYAEDDFILTLIHETGHALDDCYRKRMGLSDSSRRQREYGSTFFETLLRASNFRGDLYSKDFSLGGLRIGGVYLDLLDKNFIDKVISLYGKDELFKLHPSFDIDQKTVYEVTDQIIDDLNRDPETKRFMKTWQELSRNVINIDDVQKKELAWRQCLQVLDNIPGYEELKQFLHDAAMGKGSRDISFSIISQGEKVNSIMLYLDNEKTIELPVPSELQDVDWLMILGFVPDKVLKAKQNLVQLIDNASGVIRSQENKNSWNLWNFMSSETQMKLLLSCRKAVPYLEKLNKFSNIRLDLKFKSYLDNKELDWLAANLNTRNLDNHTLGMYNAYRLMNEEGYLKILEKGESLPIEKVMAELTRLPEDFGLTDRSAKEFFEYLKK